MDFELLTIPGKLEQSLPQVWTYMLLIARFTGLLMILPGIGGGVAGLVVRTPAILVFAFAALASSPITPVPDNLLAMALQFGAEMALGLIIGLIPLTIVNGVQAAGQISGTTMGLQASQLIDPSMNVSLPDTARIMGDLTVVVFLILGGHHVAIHAASGLGGTIVPGTFFPGELTMDVLVSRIGEIFRLGAIVSAPVLVALLLTNFVMGLITRAVPTVNIFIISFPLTIGIGLVLTILILPELVYVVSRQFAGYDGSLLQVVEDASKVR